MIINNQFYKGRHACTHRRYVYIITIILSEDLKMGNAAYLLEHLWEPRRLVEPPGLFLFHVHVWSSLLAPNIRNKSAALGSGSKLPRHSWLFRLYDKYSRGFMLASTMIFELTRASPTAYNCSSKALPGPLGHAEASYIQQFVIVSPLLILTIILRVVAALSYVLSIQQCN